MKRLNLLVYITLISCLTLCSTRSTAQNLLTQNFDGAAFPPTGWKDTLIAYGTSQGGSDNGSAGPFIWTLATGGSYLSSGSNTLAPAGHSGTQSAGFNSWDITQPGTSDLITSAINLAAYPGGTNNVSFWHVHYSGPGDSLKIYVNTSPNVSGATLLGSIQGTVYNSWAQFSYPIPSTYTGNIYIIFRAVSLYQNDMFIDDVSVDHIGCSGTPTAGTITTAPLPTPACSGGTVTITATENNTAQGITPYWQQSSSATGPWVTAVGGSGVNTATYTTPFLTSSIYYRYADTCTYTHTGAASAVYYVPVSQSTTITSQPPNAFACTGGNTSLTVGAIGGALTYQWQVSTDNGVTFNNVSGSVYSTIGTATLTITGAPLTMNGYKYRVIVGGSCGTPKTSTIPTLTVGAPPAVTGQPHDSTICANNNAAFKVTATGINLSYQWQVSTDNGATFSNLTNNAFYSGIASNTLNITFAFAYMDGYKYRVLVNGACNPTQSTAATLHVNGLPTIVTQPVNVVTCNGSTSTFTVAATGASLTYQWQRSISNGTFTNLANNTVYSGATTNTLTLHDSTNQNTNRYRVIIVGACAPIDTSNIVTLTVNPQPVVSITALTSTIICPSDFASLKGNTGAGFTYQWYYNNTLIPGATSDTFRANPAGAYNVAVTNALGCTSRTSYDTVTYLPAPTSTITAAGALGFCQGSNVVLVGNINTGVTYSWRLNGNYISNAIHSNDTVTLSGTYTLYQSNGTCGTVSNPLVVTASAVPTANIFTTGAASICSGQSIVLHTNNSSGYTFQWSLNGTPQTNGNNSTFTAAFPGTYTVQAFSGPGCSVTSSGFPVSTLPAPAISITNSGNNAICPGTVASLNAVGSANVAYQWLLNGNAINGATAVGYAASTGGIYTVTATASNACATTSAPDTIVALPAVTAVVTSNKPDTLCTPDSLVLATPAGTALHYTWYNNNQPTGDTGHAITVYGAGSYTVMVSNAACSTTSTPTIISATAKPTGYVLAQPGTAKYQGTICGNSPSLLQAPAGSSYTYQWFYQGSLISGAFSQFYSATVPGYYSVVVSTPIGCAYYAPADTVMAGTVPSPQVTFDGSQVCAQGYSSWQWYFNGQAIPNANGPCTDVHLVGGYSVSVTNSTGCSATSDVYNVLDVAVPNVANNGSIKLYPNPATSVINIDAPVQVNVNVTSIDGKLLLHAEKTKTVNIEGLANGMYLISVYDADNNLLKTEKVVKN